MKNLKKGFFIANGILMALSILFAAILRIIGNPESRLYDIYLMTLFFWLVTFIMFALIFFISKYGEGINWVKITLFTFVTSLLFGLNALLIFLGAQGEEWILLLSLVLFAVVCLFQILCIIFLLIAKIKWCKKIERNIDLILENTNKKK